MILVADEFMSDEEREYRIDLEEGTSDEETYQPTDEEQEGFKQHLDGSLDEEEVLYEATDDVLVNTLFDTCFGMTAKGSRWTTKKNQARKVIHLYDGKVDELANRWGAKFVRGAK